MYWSIDEVPSPKLTVCWKWMIGRLLSSWEGAFSGALLVSGRVLLIVLLILYEWFCPIGCAIQLWNIQESFFIATMYCIIWAVQTLGCLVHIGNTGGRIQCSTVVTVVKSFGDDIYVWRKLELPKSWISWSEMAEFSIIPTFDKWNLGWKTVSKMWTPWKINIEPRNEGLEDEFPLQTGDFQVPSWFSLVKFRRTKRGILIFIAMDPWVRFHASIL